MKTPLKPLSRACREAVVMMAGVTALTSMQALSQSGNTLEEVIVTAQHREQNLQDIPISVSALGAKDLNEAQVFGAAEIAHRVPGMSYSEFAPGQAIISMRGISSADDGAGMDNSVVMFLDGVYIGRLANINFEMFDLERIEVLRGPQGTLFGRNAIGGAINVTTSRPSDELTAKLDLSAGSEGMLRYQGLISGPLSENLSGKLSYSHREHDGYVENVILNKDQQDEDTASYRGQLMWTGDSSTWLLTGDYMEDDREDMGRVPIFPGGDPNIVEIWQQIAGDFGKVASPVDGGSKREASGIALQGDIEFDSGTLTTITAVRNAETDWQMASIGAPWVNGFEVIDDITEDIDTVSQEFRWTSNLDGNINYVGGLFFLREETDRNEQFRLAAPFGPAGSYVDIGNEISRQENETTSYAAYIQGDWDFAAAWTLTLGARYTFDEKETESTSVNCGNIQPGFEGYPGCENVGGSLKILPQTFNLKADDDWNDFSPKVSIQWRQTDDVMWFGNISKGFKSGGFGGAPGTPIQASTPVDEETAWNYELGMKGDFLDSSLRFNASVFYTDYEDLQIVRFGPTVENPGFGVFVTDNIGSADIKGFEAEFTWYPIENFSLSGNYAYLDTEINDLVIKTASGPVDASGSNLGQAPENKYALTASYDVPLNNGSGLNFRVDFVHSDEQVRDYISTETIIDEFDLWNARAAWKSADEKWEFALWGKNLGDEEYIAHSYVIGPGVIGVWGAPATYGATVTWAM